jgi:hypothetical protein
MYKVSIMYPNEEGATFDSANFGLYLLDPCRRLPA